MKIEFFEVESWEIPLIKKNLPGHDVYFSKKPLTKKNAKKDTEIISGFIYSKIGKEILELMPNLKMISTRSTGYDHIDTEECKKRGIKVCNVPAYGENTVAEHTFGLILTISRKIRDAIDKTRKGDFSLKGLRGFDLKGKTIGIVGCGNIGKNVARIAKGFEMKIIVFDVSKDIKLSKKMGFKYVSFENLLKKSDIISLHAPYNKKTRHMINSKNINKIKKGAVLINTSRGGLVETSALIKALDRGIISSAGLDVLEEECFIKEEKQLLSEKFQKTCNLRTILQNHVLLKRENVYITSHNAFNSDEAMQRILETTIKNIKGFIKKKKAEYVN